MYQNLLFTNITRTLKFNNHSGDIFNIYFGKISTRKPPKLKVRARIRIRLGSDLGLD